MGLSLQEIQQLIKEPKTRTQLQRAQRDNDWLTFHAKAVTDKLDASDYKYRFEEWIDSILIKRKAKTFFNLLKFPLPSTNLLSDTVDEMNIVFEAADRHEALEFTDEKLLKEAEVLLKKSRFKKFIRNDVFFAWLAYPNSVTITDLPAVQTTLRPEPYRFILQAGQIWDIAQDRDGNVLYVGFFTDSKKETFALIDDTAYIRLIKSGETFVIESYSPHGLGYCPAVFNSHDIYSDAEPIRRNNPVLPILSGLDDYVAGNVFKKDVDLHASFPYLWRNKEACTYRHEKAICVNGQMMEGNEPKGVCPKCEARKLVGPGTVFNVQPNMNGQTGVPVGFVNMPVDNLNYHVTELERVGQNIFKYLTGIDKQVSNKEAKNQDQVKSELSSRYAKVMYWAENLEATEQFLLETDLRLRFGKQFVSATTSYGKEYYLIGLSEAIQQYADAKTSLPMYLLEYKRKVIETLMTRNNSEEQVELAIKRLIEPYPDLPLISVPANTVEYEVKANFGNYIERFELENGSLSLFGQALSFNKKIEIIKETIYQYGRDTISGQQTVIREFRQSTEIPTTTGL